MKNKHLLFIIFVLAVFLRFYKLGSNPPSLYWEEAALGYDAYSILKTGKDFHGNKFPLVAFESFGDWKPSLYFYTLAPSIAIFGLNEFAVRFPSAFFGSLTVLLVYFLARELFSNFTSEESLRSAQGKLATSEELSCLLPIIASLLLAISPWHLQFSRAGFEANLAVFLIVLGGYLFLKSINSNIYFLFLSAISFSLSFYAYHAARLFTPLLVLGFGLIYVKKLWKQKKVVLISLFLSLFLISPIIKEYKNPAVQSRFKTTSAFATLEPILESNKRISEDGNTFIAKIIHHRVWFYTGIFFKNYFSHFNPEFLFFKGDINPRHSTGEFGLLYLIETPFLLAGIFFFLKNRQWQLIPVFLWLFLAPVPAGFTKAVPHSLRFLISIPTLQIITAYGIVNVFSSLLFIPTFQSRILGLCAGTVYCLLFFQYTHFYYKHYPEIFSQHWQYGYKEMINFVLDNQDKYDKIYISRDQGRPSIYYFFYGKIDPKKVQEQDRTAPKDQSEHLEFKKIKFYLPTLGEIKEKSLVVVGGKENFKGKLIKQLNFLDGNPVFKIYEI